MKLIAIVGTNSTRSTNRKLLQFMAKHFENVAQIEVLEIKDLPAFNEHYLKENPSDFPYDYFQLNLEKNSHDIMPHWHQELEVLYIQKGTIRIKINTDIITAKTGDLVFIQPNVLHSIHPIMDTYYTVSVFKIHLDNLGRSEIETFSQRYIQPLHIGHFTLLPHINSSMVGYHNIKNCVVSIMTLCTNKSLYYDLMLKSKLHELLYYLFSQHYIIRNYTDGMYQKYEKLKELIHYLDTHYMEPLTINFLARKFGYSRAHFMTMFKHYTGSSCVEFLLQLRLKKASELLIETTDSVSLIYEKVGFTNQANFNRQFKQRYHMTPLQYRKYHTMTN